MPDSIGLQLKNARLARNLTVEQVVKTTRIRAHHIQAIEADRLEDLPSSPAARGFLRIYTDFLGLSLDDLIARQSGRIELPPVSVEEIQPLENHSAEDNSDLVQDATSATNPEPETSSQDLQLPVLESAPPSKPSLSQNIFTSIGEQLRQRRELLGFSFDEVERHTHIRRHYLEALERGDFSHLPSSVQARGMLTNYLRFLDLDADIILLRFADGLQAKLAERLPSVSESPPGKKTNRKFLSVLKPFLSSDLIFGGGLIVLLLAFAIWGMGHVISLQNSPLPVATLSISEALLYTPTTNPEIAASAPVTQSSNPLPASSGTPITLPTAGHGPVQVYIIVLERVWFRVSVDGKIEFEGRAVPGSAWPFNGNQQIEVLTGNGSALQIIYNQTDMGIMGDFGEIVSRIYTANAVLIPTATVTQVPTGIPITSPTASLTPTPIFTPTPTPRR